MINVYTTVEDKEDFYDELEKVCEHILLLLEYFNAAGKQSHHKKTNDIGITLCTFATVTGTIVSTRFKLKAEHRITGMIPEKNEQKSLHIDHSINNKETENLGGRCEIIQKDQSGQK